MGKTFQSGVVSRLVLGGGTYSVLYNETQIDVDSSNGLPTIVKLQPIDPSIGHITVYINDYGNNCSIGNITIMASGGNLINGQPTLTLDTDGIGAEISISDQRSFIACLNNDSQGGGTVTGANNGLSLLGTVVQLGGNLITPTVINASAVNTLVISDSFGTMFKTRDSNGNFSIADFGGNSNVGSTAIFDYFSQGNQYINSTIITNFGAINLFDTVGQVFNFGQNNSLTNSNIIFNLGDGNVYTSVATANIYGNDNILNNVNDVFIIGNLNAYSNSSNLFVLGIGNNASLFGANDKVIIGNNNLNLIIDGITGYINSLPSFSASSLDTSTGVLAVDSSGNFFNTLLDYNILAGLVSNTTIDIDPVISVTDVVPITPSIGDRYLAGTAPAPPFIANYIEEWNGLSWVATAPVLDNVVFVTSTLTTLRYNGTSWVAWIGTAVLNQGNTTSSALVIGTNTAQALVFKTNNVESARVISSGSWGFGTITPSAKVSVKGQTSTSGVMAFDIKNSSSALMLSVSNDGRSIFNYGASILGTNFGHTFAGISGYTNIFTVGEIGLSNGYFSINTGGSFFLGNGASTKLLNFDNTRFWFSSADVGIGTNNIVYPSARLHVIGVDSTSSNSALKVDNSSFSPLLYVRNDGNVAISQGVYYNAKLDFGSYFINSLNPTDTQQSSHIKMYDDGSIFYGFGVSLNSLNISTNDSDAAIKFWINGEKIYIRGDGQASYFNTSGFIGINNLSPSAALHVQGFDSVSSNYSLKVDNSASTPLFYVRNDGNVYSYGVGGIATNTSFGLNNLLNNISGTDNSVYGVDAMHQNTTGSNNVAIGKGVLYNNITGSFNTALGYISLELNTSERNTGIGYGTLSINTTGFRNTAIGMFAGNTNQSGDNNVLIGYNANTSTTNLTNAIAIGSGATVSQSNTMVLGDNVNVAIGAISSSARLYIKGVDATATNYCFKADNSAAESLLYIKNDASVSIGKAIVPDSNYSLIVAGKSGGGSLRILSSAFGDLIQVRGDGKINFGNESRISFGGIGLTNTRNYIVGIGTTTDYGLYITASNQTPINLAVRDDGRITANNLPTSNIGLSTGDMYVDTAANILANGDKVVGWKV